MVSNKKEITVDMVLSSMNNGICSYDSNNYFVPTGVVNMLMVKYQIEHIKSVNDLIIFKKNSNIQKETRQRLSVNEVLDAIHRAEYGFAINQVEYDIDLFFVPSGVSKALREDFGISMNTDVVQPDGSVKKATKIIFKHDMHNIRQNDVAKMVHEFSKLSDQEKDEFLELIQELV